MRSSCCFDLRLLLFSATVFRLLIGGSSPQAHAQTNDAPLAAERPSVPLPTHRARVLVLPVVIGNTPDPEPALIRALVAGLGSNANWDITSPAVGETVAPVTSAVVAPELLNQAQRALAQVEAAPNNHSATVSTLTAVMGRLVAASQDAALGPEGAAMLLKVGTTLLAAQASTGAEAAAMGTAAALKLLLPGRAFDQKQGVSLMAAALLQAAPVPTGASVELVSNPRGCTILLDGHTVGVSPVIVPLRPSSRYLAQASCSQGAQRLESFARTIAAPPTPPEAASAAEDTAVAASSPAASPTARAPTSTSARFVLDAVFPTVLDTTAGVRLRFADAEQRRNLEEAYVPRIAERFGVHNVVLVSIGEFQSNPWLNARLYLSSGYKNRHGLARMEPARATALGRYLATGREAPGVLNAEEAGNMVAAAQTLKPLAPVRMVRTPWYSDVSGWALLGAGAATLSLGLWVDNKGDAKRDEAEFNTRNDPIRRNELNSEASQLKFWGSVGLYGGALLMGTGIVLLALPEYEDTRSRLYGLTPLPGGGAFTYSGRF